MIYFTPSLVTVNVPSTLTHVNIGAFKGSTGLASFDFTGITHIGKEAVSGTALTTATLTDSLTSMDAQVFRNGHLTSICGATNPSLSVQTNLFEGAAHDLSADVYASCVGPCPRCTLTSANVIVVNHNTVSDLSQHRCTHDGTNCICECADTAY
jgi:hypothetical protein